MRALLLVALGAAACARGPVCDSPTTVLAGSGDGALTCDDADHVAAYVEMLAGREVSATDRRQVAAGLVSRYGDDAAATRTAIEGVRATEARIMALTGLAAAEQRSAEVYDVIVGASALGSAQDDVRAVFDRAVAVWARSDPDGLALTEVDIEGWIFYASLCREAQDGGALRLSVADRVIVYHEVVTRWEGLDRDGRIALTAFGAFWPSVRDAWSIASWEEQRAWIDRAPLPPPMVATSKGYLSAVVDGDVTGHAHALHDTLGPLHLAVFR